MRAGGSTLVVAALLLGGCGAEESENTSEQTSSSSATSSSPTPSAPDTSGSSEDAAFALALRICTEDLTNPDALISDAAHGARGGTRSVAEVADAFREAQNAVGELAAEAEVGKLPNLATSLRDYADVLGRARVVGDVGLTEITDAREAVNLACYTPTVE